MNKTAETRHGGGEVMKRKTIVTWTRSQMGNQTGWTFLCDIDIWHEFGRYQVEIRPLAGFKIRATEGFRTQREAREWAEAQVRRLPA